MTLTGEVLQYNVTADTEQAKRQFRDLTVVLDATLSAAFGVLSIMGRMGLGEDVDAAIKKLTTLIIIFTTKMDILSLILVLLS